MTDPSLWDQPDPKWLYFRDARDIVQSYGLEYDEEWHVLVRGEYENKSPLPEDIPPNPDVIYRNVGWRGWSDWLISPENRKVYSSFYKSREFARSLKLKTKNQWLEYVSQENPSFLKYKINIPIKPWLEYRDKGWKSWAGWFGVQIEFRDFKTTRKFVRTLKFKTVSEWKDYCSGHSFKHGKKAKNIYAYPDIAFKNSGWKGWDDWFGISLFSVGKKENQTDLPEGAKHCRCKGLIYSCDTCDGKGYYFLTVKRDQRSGIN